ncbi:hypothetical protein KPK_2112 [Klebsiella variicola]|uniref:Uncharacterized protein n=1 Tax=Klebsiella variicola (strain 342) TaxID=507522 RepID=B5XQA1_KLEV3|nr:hypothetical protein KPK_2112 [Klebsiella variicola]
MQFANMLPDSLLSPILPAMLKIFADYRQKNIIVNHSDMIF